MFIVQNQYNTKQHTTSTSKRTVKYWAETLRSKYCMILHTMKES